MVAAVPSKEQMTSAQPGGNPKTTNAVPTKSLAKSPTKPKDSKEWKCSICASVLPTKWKLYTHRKLHYEGTGIDPNLVNKNAWKCTLCPRTFTIIDHLRLHRQSHHGGGRGTHDDADDDDESDGSTSSEDDLDDEGNALPLLHVDWRRGKTTTGHTYYWHATTMQSTWDRPLAIAYAPSRVLNTVANARKRRRCTPPTSSPSSSSIPTSTTSTTTTTTTTPPTTSPTTTPQPPPTTTPTAAASITSTPQFQSTHDPVVASEGDSFWEQYPLDSPHTDGGALAFEIAQQRIPTTIKLRRRCHRERQRKTLVSSHFTVCDTCGRKTPPVRYRKNKHHLKPTIITTKEEIDTMVVTDETVSKDSDSCADNTKHTNDEQKEIASPPTTIPTVTAAITTAPPPTTTPTKPTATPTTATTITTAATDTTADNTPSTTTSRVVLNCYDCGRWWHQYCVAPRWTQSLVTTAIVSPTTVSSTLYEITNEPMSPTSLRVASSSAIQHNRNRKHNKDQDSDDGLGKVHISDSELPDKPTSTSTTASTPTSTTASSTTTTTETTTAAAAAITADKTIGADDVSDSLSTDNLHSKQTNNKSIIKQLQSGDGKWVCGDCVLIMQLEQANNRNTIRKETVAYPCVVCGKDDDGDYGNQGTTTAHAALLCDGCDQCYHLHCLSPPLQSIPKQKWFCITCSSQSIGNNGAHGRNDDDDVDRGDDDEDDDDDDDDDDEEEDGDNDDDDDGNGVSHTAKSPKKKRKVDDSGAKTKTKTKLKTKTKTKTENSPKKGPPKPRGKRGPYRKRVKPKTLTQMRNTDVVSHLESDHDANNMLHQSNNNNNNNNNNKH